MLYLRGHAVIAVAIANAVVVTVRQKLLHEIMRDCEERIDESLLFVSREERCDDAFLESEETLR